jgi:hypothetical protein
VIKRIQRRLPSPAMVVAVIALIAALGGTATAAKVLTTKKFKNQAVRGPIQYVSTAVSVPPTTGLPNGFPVSVACPPGTQVTGGGIKLGLDQVQFVNDSHPITAGWAGTTYNTGAINHSVTTTAICVTVKSIAGTVPGP